MQEFEDARVKGIKVIVCQSQDKICSLVNSKYLSNFDKRISRTSLCRYYRIGTSEAKPRGPKPKMSKTILKAINLHTSMMQVSGTGEANPRQLKGIINAVIKSTPHEGMISEDYAYSKVLTAHSLTMEASNGRSQEDIRNQCTPYEKMLLWFKTTNSDLNQSNIFSYGVH